MLAPAKYKTRSVLILGSMNTEHTSHSEEEKSKDINEVSKEQSIPLEQSTTQEESNSDDEQDGLGKSEARDILADWEDTQQKENEHILSFLRKAMQVGTISDLGKVFEEAQLVLEERMLSSKKEAFNRFMENEGAEESAFEFRYPELLDFQSLHKIFKDERRAFYKSREVEQNQNLKKKEELVNRLRAIIEQGEGAKYSDFEAINNEWKSIGRVPAMQAETLSKEYYFNTQRFFDLLHVDRTLYMKVLEENAQTKKQLILKAKSLLEGENVFDALKSLQVLHKAWKETGPVPKEINDELWNEFTAASDELHTKKDAVLEERSKEEQANALKKKDVLQKMEQFPIAECSSHKSWQAAMQVMDGLKTEFLSLGRAPKDENNVLYGRFRESLRAFNRAKNDFYKKEKAEMKKHAQIKRALIEKAKEALESTDHEAGKRTIIQLQKEWKNSPRIFSKEGRKLWDEFSKVCNTFFDQLTLNRKQEEEELKQIFDKKEAVIQAVKGYEIEKETGDTMGILNKLKQYRADWNAVGKIPFHGKGKNLIKAFETILQKKFDQLQQKREGAKEDLLQWKAQSIVDSGSSEKVERAKQGIRREINDLVADKTRAEESVLRLNTDANSPILKRYQKEVEKLEQTILEKKDLLKQIAIAHKKQLSEAQPSDEVDNGK